MLSKSIPTTKIGLYCSALLYTFLLITSILFEKLLKFFWSNSVTSNSGPSNDTFALSPEDISVTMTSSPSLLNDKSPTVTGWSVLVTISVAISELTWSEKNFNSAVLLVLTENSLDSHPGQFGSPQLQQLSKPSGSPGLL